MFVLFSYLRWGFVWGRPQQLVTRFAQHRPVVFVEEPWPAQVDEPKLRTFPDGSVTIVRLDVPNPGRHVGFGDPLAASYPEDLRRWLGVAEPGRVALLDTPMAYAEAMAIDAQLLVYDMMDNLAGYAGAPTDLAEREQQLLSAADFVFAGGRSLYRSRRSYRIGPMYYFPSGVELEHYAIARKQRPPRRDRPIAGYVGVIDERIDVDLLINLARTLPDWDIHLIGPIIKIDPALLPYLPNMRYFGLQPYAKLPILMAGLDVAIIPFAHNCATHQISPTKTLEYLAAGLPVVSTPIPDIASEYGSVVTLADDATTFAAACRRSLDPAFHPNWSMVEGLLAKRHWARIAADMEQLVVQALLDAPLDGRR